MKKLILISAISIIAIACNKTPQTTTAAKEFKTAYVDTAKLIEDNTQAKEISEKYKAKAAKMGRELELEVKRFKAEAANFQKNAQTNGQEWAQQNGSKLQQKQQELQYAQQAMDQQLQQESGKELDTLIKSVKAFIKDYGKQKSYDYIYGTGETATVLYAKDSYDITKEVTKAINDQYANKPKTAKIPEKK